MRLLGITVLTSLSAAHLFSLGIKEELASNLEALVIRRARIAQEAGCHGVVCSGREVKAVKREFGKEFIAVTPGIRPRWSLMDKDDQQRIVTPAEAIRAGADYLVIGRPIRDASDPKSACDKTAEEISSAL